MEPKKTCRNCRWFLQDGPTDSWLENGNCMAMKGWPRVCQAKGRDFDCDHWEEYSDGT